MRGRGDPAHNGTGAPGPYEAIGFRRERDAVAYRNLVDSA